MPSTDPEAPPQPVATLVLGPERSGRSSLRVRTARALVEGTPDSGLRVIQVEISTLPGATSSSARSFFSALSELISRGVSLPHPEKRSAGISSPSLPALAVAATAARSDPALLRAGSAKDGKDGKDSKDGKDGKDADDREDAEASDDAAADSEPLESFLSLVRRALATRGSFVLLVDDVEDLAERSPAQRALLAGLARLAREQAETATPLRLALFSSRGEESLPELSAFSKLGPAVQTLRLFDFSREELEPLLPILEPLASPPLPAVPPSTGRGAVSSPAVPVAPPSPPPTELAEELAAEDRSAAAWLDEVFRFTAGQPYLTQALCLKLAARGRPPAMARTVYVDRIGRALFLDEIDPCLAACAERLDQSTDPRGLLTLYRRLQRGEPVPADVHDPVQHELWLAGLCRFPADGESAPELSLRGRIFALAFDDGWSRATEVHQLLAAASLGPGGASGSDGSLGGRLRGAALKSVQSFAVRHPEALDAGELRTLLGELEAARQEAEARHQNSAAALLRESKERADLRTAVQSERAAKQAATARAARLRTTSIAALALLGFLTLVAAVSAFRSHRAAKELAAAGRCRA